MSGSVASAAYAGQPSINGVTEVDADVLVITEGGTLSYPDYPNTVLVVQSDGTVVGVPELDETQIPTTLRSTTFPSLVVVGSVSAASATVGTLTVTGTASIGTVSTSSLALSGTLSVAGATTLAACSASSLTVSGAATLNGFTTVNDDLLVMGDMGAVGGFFQTLNSDHLSVANNSALAITSVTTFTATGPATMAAITCSSLTASGDVTAAQGIFSGRIYSSYSAASQMAFTPGTAATTFILVEGPAGGVNRRIRFVDPGAANRDVLYTDMGQFATLGPTTFSGAAPQVQLPGDGTASATQELWFGQDDAGETQWRLLGANSTFGSNFRIRSRLGGVNSDKLIVQASGTSIWSNLGIGKAPTANALDVLGATLLQALTCTTLSCTTLTTSSDGVIGGNLTVTGTITLAAVTMGSLNCSGNAIIGGTLAVSGASTLAATTVASLSCTGALTVGTTLGVTGVSTLAATTVASLTCTGAATVGTTLGVTGNCTFSANVGIGTAPSAGLKLNVTGNPTNLTRSATVPAGLVRVLNVSDSNSVTWSANSDPTDAGRIMQVYNGSGNTAANIQAVLSLHIIGSATANRVLSDLKMIRETAGQGNGAFVLTGRTSAASIVMRDYAYFGWTKALISPGAGNPVTLGSQTAPTAGYLIAMGTAGGTTDGHTEVNGNLLVRGTATVSGAITLAAVSCSSLAVSGNATVGGTLGVTGASTLAAVTCTTLTTSSDAVVGGTLDVAGESTFAAVTCAALTCSALTCTGSASLGTTLADRVELDASVRQMLTEDTASAALPRTFCNINWARNMNTGWGSDSYIVCVVPIKSYLFVGNLDNTFITYTGGDMPSVGDVLRSSSLAGSTVVVTSIVGSQINFFGLPQVPTAGLTFSNDTQQPWDDWRRIGAMLRLTLTMREYNTTRHGIYRANVSMNYLTANTLSAEAQQDSDDFGMPGVFNGAFNSFRIYQPATLPTAFWIVFTHGLTLPGNYGCLVDANLLAPGRTTQDPYWIKTNSLVGTSTTVVTTY